MRIVSLTLFVFMTTCTQQAAFAEVFCPGSRWTCSYLHDRYRDGDWRAARQWSREMRERGRDWGRPDEYRGWRGDNYGGWYPMRPWWDR